MSKIYKGQVCYTIEESKAISEKHIREQAEILRKNLRRAHNKEDIHA